MFLVEAVGDDVRLALSEVTVSPCVEVANRLEPGLHLALMHQGTDLVSRRLRACEYRSDGRRDVQPGLVAPDLPLVARGPRLVFRAAVLPRRCVLAAAKPIRAAMVSAVSRLAPDAEVNVPLDVHDSEATAWVSDCEKAFRAVGVEGCDRTPFIGPPQVRVRG